MSNSRKALRLSKDITNHFTGADVEFTLRFIQNHKDDASALNAVDKYGNTPLIIAAREGHTDIVKLFLANPHVDVNAINDNGDTALIVAALMAWAHIANILLEHKDTDVNIRNKHGDTALHTAITIEDPEFIDRLLRHYKTNVNLKNLDGQTALHAAKLVYNENRKRYVTAASCSDKSLDRDMQESYKVLMSLSKHPDIDESIRDIHGKKACDYEYYYTGKPAAPIKAERKTYKVDADEYHQFLMWKKEKSAASVEEQTSSKRFKPC